MDQSPQETSNNSPAESPQITVGAGKPRHACGVCQQVWPEDIMLNVEGAWLCSLCKERALGTKRTQMTTTSAFDFKYWRPVLLVVLLIVLRYWRASMQH